MRLFLAIKPDRQAEARLAQRLLELQDALGELAPALRWTPAANVHATLHFLGEVAASRLPALRAAIEPPLPQPAFEVEVDAVGAFPETGAPRVVWLDVARGADQLSIVHAELAGQLAAAGFRLETRPFSPHLTVARVPDRERARVKRMRERLLEVGPMPIAWTVTAIPLFRSDLSGPVPRYDVVQETLLATHA